MRIMSCNEFDQLQEDGLLKKFEEIHDFIYANDGLSPQQTLNEFLKILFIKVYDEKGELNLFNISKQEYSDIQKSGLSNVFTERINKLFQLTKQEYSEIFDSDDKIKISLSSLCFTINKLQSIQFSSSSSDAKGIAFQKFLTHQEKIEKGQFFTPQPVIDFCVQMISPRYGELVLDPCCGSGGFINSAFKYISKGLPQDERRKVISDYIYGVDINRDITKISKMKFLLEENVRSNVFCANSLDDLDNIRLQLFNGTKDKGVDVLLTNPPFGTTGKITNQLQLSSFALGHKWKENNGEYYSTDKVLNGQPAEILFIERCLDLLKDGGRMAIVLPNGHFENPSLNYLRSYIKSRARILAIVNLPADTFIPYGTGVKTSLLFLEKRSFIDDTNYPVFFSRITKLGYQGNKNATPVYKKNSKGEFVIHLGNKILDEDFSIVLADYDAYNKGENLGSGKSFVIMSNEIKSRFDYDYYCPENHNALNILKGCGVRLCEIVDIVKGKSIKLKDKEREVEYVELSDINTHSFEIINTTKYKVFELPSRATFEIREGDILTAVAGNSIGTKKHATALVGAEYDGAICTNGIKVLRNPKINPYYLLYYLHSDLFLKQVMMLRTGAAIPNISDIDLANVLVYLPDKFEIELIGEKIKKAFELRQESVKLMNGSYFK